MKKILTNFLILIVSIILLLVLFVSIYTNNISLLIISTLKTWLYKVMPPIFIFYIISSILLKLNFFDYFFIIFKPLNKLLKFSNAYALNLYLSNFIIGNPSISSLAYDDYQNNNISKSDYNKIINSSFSANPLFIISLINNIQYSIIILSSIIISSIIICTFTNHNKIDNININKKITNTNISIVFYKSIEIVLVIASIMIFFNLIINTLNYFQIPNYFCIPLELCNSLIIVVDLNLVYILKIPLMCSLIVFNCFSIHIQIFSQIKYNYAHFLLSRIIASTLSFIICFIIFLHF